MKTSLMKSALLAAAVVLATGSLVTPAAAGPNFGQGHVMRHGAQVEQFFSDHRRHYDRRIRDRVCQPGEAIHKARRLGLRHAGIERVNHRVVVVSGRHRGHWATIAFDRTSRHCRIVRARGI